MSTPLPVTTKVAAAAASPAGVTRTTYASEPPLRKNWLIA
jgi:hypothetical protein